MPLEPNGGCYRITQKGRDRLKDLNILIDEVKENEMMAFMGSPEGRVRELLVSIKRSFPMEEEKLCGWAKPSKSPNPALDLIWNSPELAEFYAGCMADLRGMTDVGYIEPGPCKMTKEDIVQKLQDKIDYSQGKG